MRFRIVSTAANRFCEDRDRQLHPKDRYTLAKKSHVHSLRFLPTLDVMGVSLMRVAELSSNEDLDTTMRETLSRGFSAVVARSVTVTHAGRGAQEWYYLPVFSAFVTRDAAREVREHLVAQFRYTPRTWRAVPQWLVGTFAGSPPLLAITRLPAFSVTPAIAHARSMLVVPGNHRLRLHDFRARVSRVLLKEGFSPRSVLTELEVRAEGPGPFPPVLAADPDGSWFVEPLLEGFTLPRCPPWRSRRTYERRAIELLDGYHAAHAIEVSTADYLDDLRATVAHTAASIAPLPGAPQAIESRVDALARRAHAAKHVEVARGHGDFQSGNVFVEPDKDNVWLIDWETSAVRQRVYDALTYGLAARFPRGLGTRARAFVDGTPLGVTHSILPPGRGWRGTATSLFLLEDLRWRLEQAARGRYFRAPASLSVLIGEIDVFLRG